MGCLKNIFKAVILVLAVIGFTSLGGKDYFVKTTSLILLSNSLFTSKSKSIASPMDATETKTATIIAINNTDIIISYKPSSSYLTPLSKNPSACCKKSLHIL